MAKLHNKSACKPVYGKEKKIKMLWAGLGSVHIGKNCDWGLEKPQSQFFPIWTLSRPITYIYFLKLWYIKYLNPASDGMFLCTLHPVAAITNSSAVSPLSPCRKTMSLSALVSLLFSFSLNFLTFLFSGGCGFIG